MLQQFKSQRDNPRKVLYVQGNGWASSRSQLTPAWDEQKRFSDLNLRVCPTSLLTETRSEYLRKLADTLSATSPQHMKLPPISEKLAGSTHPLNRGRLGYFSLTDCDLIESLGQVPWKR